MEKRKIWFVSDTHFGHDKDFIWGDRGYKNIHQMNEDFVKKWNTTVGPNDIVYHLGDVIMGNASNISWLKRLHGEIHIAIGNHDTASRIKLYKECHNVAEVQMGYRIKSGKKTLILTHYPTLVSNGGYDRVISVHGHTHDKSHYSDVPYCYNVNMDATDGYLVDLDSMMEDINKNFEKVWGKR